MAAFPRIDLHETIAQLYQSFLESVRRSQQKLVDLDLGEIQAICLAALSNVGGSPSVLMLPSREHGDFRLELSSEALSFPPERLRFRLSAADEQELVREPEKLQVHGDVQRLARELELADLFAECLVLRGRVTGALLLLPVGGRKFSGEDRERLHLLARQIRMMVESADLISTLIGQAMVDDLTGLFNHRYFRIRLPAEISRASRHGHPLSLLFCDIDDFKNFNDRNGHSSGNLLLRDLSELLRSGGRSSDVIISFRNSDIPVRFGGEEFAVILPETPKWGALTKAERLRKAIELAPFTGRESQPSGQVTISIGVAAFPEDASDAASLLESADKALLRAKQQGKNRVEPA